MPATSSQSILSHEISLRERLSLFPVSPHEQRVRACMEFLDAIPNYAPALGPVMATVKQELECAIYSNQLTLTPQLSSQVEAVTNLDKIPWFVLVTRLGDMRRSEITQTQDNLTDLMHKLKIRERDMSLLQKRIIHNKQELQTRDETIAELRDRVKHLENHLSRKDSEFDEKRREWQGRMDALQREKDTVELNLVQANATIERLSVFKTNKDSNDDQLSARIWVTDKKELVVPEAENVTEVSIKETETLQRQLFEIMNNYTDDLETALLQIRKKREILGGAKTAEDEEEANHLVSEFESAMSQLQEEQALLAEHKASLINALEQLKDTQEYLEWKKYSQETQRKYSICMYTSTDGGKTFKLWKDAPYCFKCSERVVMCPHMHAPATLDPFIKQTTYTCAMPKGATHFMFQRGGVKIHVPAKTTIKDSFAIREEEHEDFVEMKIHRASRWFRVIWHDYFNRRKHFRPLLPRIYTLDKMTRLMGDLYEARWKYEAIQYSNTDSFLGFFHSFLLERYRVPVVASRVAFEVLSAFEHHQDTNVNIQMFVRHLAGSDSCAWKYTRLVASYINLMEPLDISRYQLILHTLYPCRSESLYEHLELELQVYTGGSIFGGGPLKITGDAVREQIKNMLLKNIEPNVRAFRRLLAKYDVRRHGYLDLVSFLDAANEILPTALRDFCTQHYKISEHDYAPDRVSLERLGQILSYAYVHVCNLAGWGLLQRNEDGNRSPLLSTEDLGSEASDVDKAPSLTTLPPIQSSLSNRIRGLQKAGMPSLRHLREELIAFSKIEQGDGGEAELRRIEMILKTT